MDITELDSAEFRQADVPQSRLAERVVAAIPEVEVIRVDDRPRYAPSSKRPSVATRTPFSSTIRFARDAANVLCVTQNGPLIRIRSTGGTARSSFPRVGPQVFTAGALRGMAYRSAAVVTMNSVR